MGKQRGFTLVEIMITVAIIGILVSIAVPSFLRARDTTRTRAIQHDLVKIDDATRIYIIEYNMGSGDTMPTLEQLVALGYLRSRPEPPVLGDYVAATAFSELGVVDPDAYPSFAPASGTARDEWRHPDLINADAN